MATNNGAQNAVADANANAGAQNGTNANANANDGNRADTSRVADANAGNNNGGGGAAKKFEYTEDRSDWVPRHRLNDESGKRQTLEQQLTALKADLEKEQKRVRAALGVDPANPQAEEQAEVEEALVKILERKYPGLAALQRLKPEQFDAIIQGAMAGQSAQDSAADAQRDAAFESCYTEAAKVLRKDTLSDRQKRGVREAFATEFRSAMQERNAKREQGIQPDANDFVSRYLRNDRTLFTEFVKEYLSDWYEDAKRNVTATTVRRNARPVPNGGRSETVVTGGVQHDLTTNDGFKKAIVEARAASQSGA